jgi:predicted anti-sigma-YlaC factor YlaD
MLMCKEVTELCSRELEQPLSLREKMGIGAHLMMCSACTNFRKQVKLLRTLSTTYAEGKAVASERGDERDE